MTPHEVINTKWKHILQEIGEMPIFKTTEEKVRYERKLLHLSEDYVAGWCGLTPWEYSCIEAGYGRFSDDEITLLEELFLIDLRQEGLVGRRHKIFPEVFVKYAEKSQNFDASHVIGARKILCLSCQTAKWSRGVKNFYSGAILCSITC